MRFAALLATMAGLWMSAPASAQDAGSSSQPAPIVIPADDAATATPAAEPTLPIDRPADDILVTSIASPDVPPATDAPATAAVTAPLVSVQEPAPVIDPAAVVVDAPTSAPVVADAVIPPPAPEAATAAPAVAEAPAAALAVPATDPAAPPVPAVTLAMSLQHEQLPGMCVSLSGRGGESESRPCDGSAIQTFVLPAGAPGPIRNGDLCLAPQGKGSYPQLSAVTCNGALEQTWTVTPEGEIRSAAGRCLSLLGNSSRSGERVYAGECPAGLPAHRWRAVANDPAYLHPITGMLEAVSRPGKCLGTDGSLGLVACDARLGRVFSFDSSAPSQFRMMSSCLASGYAFNSLALGQCWNMPAQKWSLTASANLVNLEGKCIVVTIEEGRDVLRMGACLPVPEQQWTLKEIAP